MKWLHISDIHFKNMGYKTDVLRNSFLREIEKVAPKLDFILITGDCFYQNCSTPAIISELTDFVRQIKNICKTGNKSKVYLCAGNHDIDRNNDKRNKIIDKIRKNGISFQDEPDSLLSEGYTNYSWLCQALTNNISLDYSLFEPRNMNVRIISVNSCLLSKDDNDYRQLKVCTSGLSNLTGKIKNDGKLNLIIMHHSLDWLQPDDARSFEHWVEDNNIDAIFSGHTHIAAVDVLNDVNREIYQFTAGALKIDDYAIPSFYLCEWENDSLELSLYTFSGLTDEWAPDTQHLRKFERDGKHSFILSRLSEKSKQTVDASINQSLSSGDAFIQNLNNKYVHKFGHNHIFSNKSGEKEDFNGWKIVSSLADIGIPYSLSLKLAKLTVDQIISDKYPIENIINSSELKSEVYNSILRAKEISSDVFEYDIGIWASRYSRHYDKGVGFSLIDGQERKQITYGILKSEILKEVAVRITGNEVYYNLIYSNELHKMSERVMKFIKSLGIFEIKKEVLLDVICEYVSRPPHPWFVYNNRDDVINYHIRNAEEQIRRMLNDASCNGSFQIESSYHIFAALLSRYNDYIGCTENSPITIIHQSIRRRYTSPEVNLPIRRCMLIQMMNDLRNHAINIESFIEKVEIVYENIVVKKDVANKKTQNTLVELREILNVIADNYKEEWQRDNDVFNSVYKIFKQAVGFEVKNTIRYFEDKAFIVKPYWDEFQKSQYNLGEDIIVFMIDMLIKDNENKTIDKIIEYLGQDRKKIFREIVLFKNTVDEFTAEERKTIRKLLYENNIKVRCVFIQEKDFVKIDNIGWRPVFYDIICRSRNTY